MAIKFNRSQTFATNGTVTASGLHNLVDGLDIYQAIITDQTVMSSVGTGDKLLIADADLTASDAPRAVTVGRLLDDALTSGTYTSAQFSNNLSYGTATGNRTVSTNATITTGTVTTLVSNNATLGTTTGTAATFTNATSTGASITNGTIQTLTSSTANITGGTFGGVLNSSSGTISGDLTISDKIIHSGDTNTAIRFPSNDTVSIETNGTTALTINSNQAASFDRSVSINGVSPDYRALTIENTSGVKTQISANGNYAGEVRTVTDHPILFLTNNTEKLRIGTSGQIGIGGANYGTSGQVFTSTGTGSAPSWQTPTPAKILQVVSETYSTEFIKNTNNYSDTGLSASITPSSATNKVLVTVTQPVNITAATNPRGSINCVRTIGTTSSTIFTPGVGMIETTGTELSLINTMVFLDSPNTTSQTTYKTQSSRAGSTVVTTSIDNVPATIILMEVA